MIHIVSLTSDQKSKPHTTPPQRANSAFLFLLRTLRAIGLMRTVIEQMSFQISASRRRDAVRGHVIRQWMPSRAIGRAVNRCTSRHQSPRFDGSDMTSWRYQRRSSGRLTAADVSRTALFIHRRRLPAQHCCIIIVRKQTLARTQDKSTKHFNKMNTSCVSKCERYNSRFHRQRVDERHRGLWGDTSISLVYRLKLLTRT